MKILVVGDQHFRLDLPYADYIADRRQSEKEEVFETIHAAAKKADVVVFLGDNLHARHNHSSVLKEYVNFLKGFGDKALYIIAGNHEVYNGTDTAIDFLRDLNVPNWHVMTDPSLVTIHGMTQDIDAWFVPYQTNAALEAIDTDEARERLMKRLIPADIIFHHHAVSGTKTLGAMTDLFNEIVLPREELEQRFSLVVGGHIHQPDYRGRTIVSGSLFTADMGEDRKSVWLINTEKLPFGVEEIPLPVRPIIKADNTTDLETLPKYAIVKYTNRDKEADIDALKEKLRTFDAFVLVEDYPSERVKTHIDEGALEDLSIPTLLREYAKQKNLNENELLSAFELVK